MSPEERRAWCADLKRGDKVFVHGPGYNPSPDDPDTVVATLDDEVIVAIGGEPGIILRFDRFGIETGTASTWITPAHSATSPGEVSIPRASQHTIRAIEALRGDIASTLADRAADNARRHLYHAAKALGVPWSAPFVIVEADFEVRGKALHVTYDVPSGDVLITYGSPAGLPGTWDLITGEIMAKRPGDRDIYAVATRALNEAMARGVV